MYGVEKLYDDPVGQDLWFWVNRALEYRRRFKLPLGALDGVSRKELFVLFLVV